LFLSTKGFALAVSLFAQIMLESKLEHNIDKINGKL